ncbi:phosphogluconate dehydratase [Cohaesibacter haloalkalitolerans]|uniref:phosphogluconate dehydratase n=1 Tax=Cohaesibacter haloalkalitolerans TaxID=1162980 RepID=UPI000E64C4A0|nr:phosphogluconate dehydratase [Cohaesibacter haloalkalitolerans]
MTCQDTISRVTDRIRERSESGRAKYLAKIDRAIEQGPGRAHLTCGNLSHAFAAANPLDKEALATAKTPNLGIITAYNDMLSAHQPYETYPELIRETARSVGATAQVAGAVPAMCDGVTQGQAGMDLSLYSREVVAMAAAVGLSHNVFDSVVFLGVCDKIVPGLIMAAAAFGHLPAVFLPAGPMTSGLANAEKARVRQDFAKGIVGREELLKSEMASYHAPGTCTFYGTANTNQMLMEFLGLQMSGSSFVNPNTEMRAAITKASVERALQITNKGDEFIPFARIFDEKALVNGIVGLNATGGSTNHLLHLVAMARVAGIELTWQDFSDISAITPLLARVYPNGLADVNHFHAAGGLPCVVGQLIKGGLLHEDVQTVMGEGIEHYTKEPKLDEQGRVRWGWDSNVPLDPKIIATIDQPFQKSGGIKTLKGNIGEGVMKVSAVAAERHSIEAPVAVFHNQDDVKTAFQSGDLNKDVIVVVRYQGPKANGMPELHNLTPMLSVLQDKGFKVALLTDGRMSGASGKVPAAIHICPEACDGGAIAQLQDGDIVRIDANEGKLEILDPKVLERPVITPDLAANYDGMGRDLFSSFRKSIGPANKGAISSL